MKKYKTIVIDPPWELKMGATRTGNGTAGRWNDKKEYQKIKDLQYPTMTIEELEQLEIPADKDAHIYIWTINSKIEATYHLCRLWGFRPVQLLTWCKAPMGMGLGGAFVQLTEHILFGKCGSLPKQNRVGRNWWEWKRGEHSAKPEAFQDYVMVVSPPPYLEMFARRYRMGWGVWGNEVESDVRLEVVAANCT